MTTRPRGLGDPTLGFAESDTGSAVTCIEIDAIPLTPFLVNFVFGNFFLATFLISLATLIVFLIVVWLTVLRDARLMKDQVLSNATRPGVSHHPYYNEWVLLTVMLSR